MAFHNQGQRFLNELPEILQDLPVSPKFFQTLFSLTNEHSSSSLQDIAKAMEKDQGLTVKVLTMANSAYYGLQSQVSSVHRAVLVLGVREIRKLILLMNIRTLDQRIDPDIFDVPGHWRHQVDVAHAAKEMARHTPGIDPEELFTIGLLHDLGKMITALHRPKDWRNIQELSKVRHIPLYVAEDTYWGLDHALIGALILKSWFLPLSLTEPINWHHAPTLADDYSRQAKMMRLVDILVHQHVDNWDWSEKEVSARDFRDLHLPDHLSQTLIPEMVATGQTDKFLQSLGITNHQPIPSQ